MFAFCIIFALFALLAQAVDDSTFGCTDVDNIVSCCVDTQIILFPVDACAELIIDFDDLDIELEFVINGVVLFDETFGFDTAPELCAELWGVEICLAIENLEYDNWILTGCLDLIIAGEDIELGCFSLGE